MTQRDRKDAGARQTLAFNWDSDDRPPQREAARQGPPRKHLRPRRRARSPGRGHRQLRPLPQRRHPLSTPGFSRTPARRPLLPRGLARQHPLPHRWRRHQRVRRAIRRVREAVRRQPHRHTNGQPVPPAVSATASGMPAFALAALGQRWYDPASAASSARTRSSGPAA